MHRYNHQASCIQKMCISVQIIMSLKSCLCVFSGIPSTGCVKYLVSIHREGVNPSSMEGVLHLSDHISAHPSLKSCLKRVTVNWPIVQSFFFKTLYLGPGVLFGHFQNTGCSMATGIRNRPITSLF